MPRTVKSLTAQEVKGAKPGAKITRLFDGKGLYLEVTPSGSKRWRLKYRLHGRERLAGLGPYPEVSLAEARKRRRTIREQVRDDIDPIEKKRQERAAEAAKGDSFETVATAWHEHHSREWSDTYAKRVYRRLEIDVFPAIGDMPISEIRPADIVALLEAMQERGVGETAYRAGRDLEGIFDYAKQRDKIASNPAARLTRKKAQVLKKPKVKHFAAITEKDQLGELLRAIDGYRGDSQGTTKLALSILSLTMVRPGELRHGVWPELDFDEALWTIPATRMKMDRDHLVPLSDQALAAFRALHKVTGKGTLMLPSIRSKERPVSDNTFNAALRRLGYDNTQMTAHGFRSTASTILNEEGWNSDWIEMQLSHVEQSGSRAPYNRAKYLDQRRHMLQAWADMLDGLRREDG